jgi:hypothetical protein
MHGPMHEPGPNLCTTASPAPQRVPSLERDDPLARFTVAMCMARNDVSHALTQWEQADERGSAEAAYWLRVATSHFFEAERAVKAWRQEAPEVRQFITQLPPHAKEQLRKATTAIQKLGTAVEHSRDRTFHYPYPTSKYPTVHELSIGLEALRKEEVLVVSDGNGLDRLHFADYVAFALALAEYDRSTLRDQGKIVGTGARGFVNFATCVWTAYGEARGLELRLPAPGD